MSEVLVMPAVIMAINVLVLVGLVGYIVYSKTIKS
jgi:preprotein translocase subunit Sss1